MSRLLNAHLTGQTTVHELPKPTPYAPEPEEGPYVGNAPSLPTSRCARIGKKEIRSGIYTITSPSGKQYVGSTVRFKQRWKVHICELRKGTHHSRALQFAANKYGVEALVFARFLSVPSKEDLIAYEQIVIDTLKPAYNMCPVAGSILGFKQSDETRAKLRAVWACRKKNASKGKPYSRETRLKVLATSAKLCAAWVRRKQRKATADRPARTGRQMLVADIG
ncbi:GIY-YIG nuclease family protein [Paraburkholderia sediminicola]|nr:GIY-YIG nuclease family protein [Paraburkholderia sediminicola]